MRLQLFQKSFSNFGQCLSSGCPGTNGNSQPKSLFLPDARAASNSLLSGRARNTPPGINPGLRDKDEESFEAQQISPDWQPKSLIFLPSSVSILTRTSFSVAVPQWRHSRSRGKTTPTRHGTTRTRRRRWRWRRKIKTTKLSSCFGLFFFFSLVLLFSLSLSFLFLCSYSLSLSFFLATFVGEKRRLLLEMPEKRKWKHSI